MTPDGGSGPEALRVRALSKEFDGVTVLDHVDLSLNCGRIRAVLGANGAGKSTLVKILSGYHRPTAGAEVQIFGQPVGFPVKDAESLGLGVVHQDLGLADGLSVTENLAAGRRWRGRGKLTLHWQDEHAAAREWLVKIGLDVDPRTLVADLSPAQRALVSIVRTVRRISERGHADRCVLILDEPTAYLSTSDARTVLDTVRQMVAQGAAVMLISHRIRETQALADDVTVLRNGKVAWEGSAGTASEADLVRLMLGDVAAQPRTQPGDQSSAEVLRVDSLSGQTIRQFSLSAAAGEIVGVTGIIGMGAEELPYLIYGSDRRAAGHVNVRGRTIDSPRSAIRNRMFLTPGNRDRDALWMTGTAAENLSIAVLGSLWRHGILRRRRERSEAADVMRRHRINPLLPMKECLQFSGGNRQKISLAKWLRSGPQVLLLHEPSQGIDALARAEILAELQALAARGGTVVIFSADYEFLVSVCSRVVTIVDGRIQAQLSFGEITEEAIISACQPADAVN
jgi:ribose transport system ATP-binding protein